jgi:hypothetical protein
VQFVLHQGSPAAAMVPLLLKEHGMVDEISEQVRDFADAWDELADKLEEYCGDARQAYDQAGEAFAALEAMQQRLYTDFDSETVEERLREVADVDLDEIVIDEPKWVDAFFMVPRLQLSGPDEAGDEDDDAEAAQ